MLLIVLLISLIIGLLFLWYYYVNHLHRFHHLYNPYKWYPLIGTFYVEFFPENRSVMSYKRHAEYLSAAGARSNAKIPKLYTEFLPVFGRALVVADCSEACRLLKQMGRPESLLERHHGLHHIYQAVFDQGLQNSWGEDWSWRRKSLSHFFTGRMLMGSLFEFILQQTRNILFPILDEAATTGKTVKLCPLMEHLTLSIILYHFLGSFDPKTIPPQEIIRLVDEHLKKKLQLARQQFQEVFTEPMAVALEENRGIVGGASQPESRYNAQNLLSESLGLIFAGYETSASAISMFLAQLIAHPNELVKVRREIEDVLSMGPLTPKSSGHLVVLTAAFNESMRLLPPAAANLFEVRAPGNILGTTVKPGDVVAINHYACSRDTRVYGADVESFRPERYLVSVKELEASFDAARCPQLAFSFGSHTCLGKNLTLLESRLVMAELLDRYDFQFATPDYKPHYAINPKKPIPPPVDHLPLIVKLRNSNKV